MSRRRLGFALALVCVIGIVVVTVLVTRPRPPDYEHPQSWSLAWSDEFDESSVDPGRWRVEDLSTFGEGNLELACLMSANADVAGGQVRLTARREEPPLTCGSQDTRFPDGRDYSSAMLTTQRIASWRYGRIEIRAALPTAPGTSKGLWPALWLRPDDLGKGEIDIVEAVGTGAATREPGVIHQTLHYDYTGTHPQVSSVPTLPAGFDPTEFHVYAVQLRPGRLEWLVDGVVTFSLDPTTTPWLDEVLGSPYFLRMNLAVGGRWPGAPTASTTLPAAMAVDWVRVYQP